MRRLPACASTSNNGKPRTKTGPTPLPNTHAALSFPALNSVACRPSESITDNILRHFLTGRVMSSSIVSVELHTERL